MIITIVSLSDQVLYINLPTYSDYEFFSDLFESNNRKGILSVQIANQGLKSRLKIFDELSRMDKKYLALKAVFESIPEDSKFIVVAGKVDDTILLLSLKQEVNKLNGIVNTSSNSDNIEYIITSLYYTHSFNGNTKRMHYIGDNKQSNPVCRFCGEQVPVVSFKHKSHAISESLGNKSLICREECDDCNERFSRTIEPDIANMLSPFLTLYSIHGKNGIRTTTGKNFKLSIDKSTQNNANEETIKIWLNQKLPENIEDISKCQLPLDASSLKYIPQNVYKCLCKYVVSVINRRHLPNFKKTIDWINSTTKYCKLPLVAIGNSQIKIDAPYLIVSIRKTDNYNYPYCFALFVIANMAFAFIVPFTSEDKYQFTTSQKHAIFQEMVQSWYKGFKWSFNKLSSSKKTYTQVDFTIQIPSECKLEKDFFIISKNQ